MLGRIGMRDERKLITPLPPCKGTSMPIIRMKGLHFIYERNQTTFVCMIPVGYAWIYTFQITASRSLFYVVGYMNVLSIHLLVHGILYLIGAGFQNLPWVFRV
jgi:hypothetical protein